MKKMLGKRILIAVLVLLMLSVSPLTVNAAVQGIPTTSANLPNGRYRVQHKGSDMYLAILSSVKDSGALVQICGYFDNTDQMIDFTRLPDNTYKLAFVHSGKVLDVAGANMDANAAIHQWDWTDGANQHWYVVDCGDGFYKFVAKHSGLTLDVPNNSDTAGTALIQYADNGGDSQRFRIIPQETASTPEKPAPDMTVPKFQNAIQAMQIGVEIVLNLLSA